MRSPSWRVAFGLLFTGLTASAAPPPVSAPAPAGAPGRATIILASRSIGSKRGEPPAREAHAALLVRFEGKPGGFIVQGGPSPVAGTARMACNGWVIPSADPDRDFTRAVGAYWGEDAVARELPARTLATFTVSGLDEARLRALVKELVAELRPHDYRFDRGPNSNSFTSLLLDKFHLLAPAANAEDLPGWGWTREAEVDVTAQLKAVRENEISLYQARDRYSADFREVGFAPQACSGGARPGVPDGTWIAGCRYIYRIQVKGTCPDCGFEAVARGVADPVKGVSYSITDRDSEPTRLKSTAP